MPRENNLEQRIFIDFDNKRMWCFVCQEWISADSLFIDGTHKQTVGHTDHTVYGEYVEKGSAVKVEESSKNTVSSSDYFGL